MFCRRNKNKSYKYTKAAATKVAAALMYLKHYGSAEGDVESHHYDKADHYAPRAEVRVGAYVGGGN